MSFPSIPARMPDGKNPSEPFAKLPDVTVDSTQGRFELPTLQGHYTLLYFYPRDLTAGCTTQAQEFCKLLPQFEKLDVKIYGISRDSLKSHHTFTLKERIAFALISDPAETLCRHFEVIKTKNMYGKQVQGVERSSFLFNRQGQLIQSWRKVKAAGHAALVLNFIQQQA